MTEMSDYYDNMYRENKNVMVKCGGRIGGGEMCWAVEGKQIKRAINACLTAKNYRERMLLLDTNDIRQ